MIATGKATLYEVIVERSGMPGTARRIPLWVRDRGQGSILRALRHHDSAYWRAVVDYTGHDSFAWDARTQAYREYAGPNAWDDRPRTIAPGEWFVGTGRTERQAEAEGLLPLLGETVAVS